MKDREDQLFYTVNDCLLSIKLLYMIGSSGCIQTLPSTTTFKDHHF